jgi:flagellar motor component MotA
MSIPITLIIYRYVFGIQYFASIHISALIIIIGIGTDDLMVYHNQWKIEKDAYNSLKKCFKSMFVTSLTSALAFFSTSYSSIMPV